MPNNTSSVNGTSATGNHASSRGSSTVASAVLARAEGENCHATASHALAEGYMALASRYQEYARSSGGFGTTRGSAQMSEMHASIITTDEVAQTLFGGGGSGFSLNITGTGTNVLTVLAGRAMTAKFTVVGRRTDVQGEMAGFTWEGLVGRDTTGSARIIGTPTVNAWSDAAAAVWGLAVSVNATDPTRNYLMAQVTGEAAKNIRWSAKLEWVEVAS